MTKRIIVILFLTLGFAYWRDAGLSTGASAQKQSPAAPAKGPDYSKFKHSTHVGRVKSLTVQNKSVELGCAYCHGAAVKDKLSKDQHDVQNLGFPSHKFGMPNEKTHSACTECHADTGRGAPRPMCLICHEKLTIYPKEWATNIRRFPNPDAGGVSEFFDDFSHKTHVDWYSNYVTDSLLNTRFKFFNEKEKPEAKANKGLDKDKFECLTCHTKNQAPVTLARISFGNEAKKNQVPATVSKVAFQAGVKMSPPGHPECFVCHFDSKIVSPQKKTFAANCAGCHLETGKASTTGRPIRGSEKTVLWFARQIVNNELNPKKPGSELKSKKPDPNNPDPFSHETHDGAVGQAVADCLSCHATGKTANTRSDFYLEDRKTKENQPLAWSCVDCHKKEMQTKIEGAVKLETAKCNYCHSLKTINEYKAKGVSLPPANHFWKKPPATSTPTPIPPAAEAPKPEAAPTPTPPKPSPAPTPAPKTESAPGTTQPKPTPTPAPQSTTVVVTPPVAVPPKPTPTPTPAPKQAAGPATGSSGKPQTMPKTPRLGDPKDSPHWGLDDKWGVVDNFNHETHITPKYSKRCEDCHHTNQNAREEMTRGLVPLCVSCHKEIGNSANPTNKKTNEEIDVKLAYHGNPNNENNNAGCIECHKRYYDKNPDADRLAPTSKCAGCHVEKQAWLDPRRAPVRPGYWLVEQWASLFKEQRLNARAIARR